VFAEAAALTNSSAPHAAGWKIPDVQGFKSQCAGGWGKPAGSLYCARVDGKPAATAILYVADKVGYCADAATDPAFRGRGLQAALLARPYRRCPGRRRGFVCSGAEFLSQSHRNMERAGMRVQFVRSLWTAL